MSPVRYESYGLNVQEALCCGVPAIVSHNAGVAERYPAELSDLLLANPPTRRISQCGCFIGATRLEDLKRRIAPLSATLRSWTWDDMAAQMIAVTATAERASDFGGREMATGEPA